MESHTHRKNADQPGGTKTELPSPVVTLLSDDPSDVDEFEAKAHDQVARSIADLVVAEPGGAVIGLEGTYGSGKSTVVRLVSAKLANHKAPERSSQTRAVIFDAWAHQGDPLRRSFLETVIKELADADWLSKDLADGYSAILSGKTSTVVTKTTARLSLEGKLTSAAAVLLPLGAVLASNHFSHYHRAALYAGVGLLLGPIGVVLGLYVVQKLASRNLPSDAGKRRRRLAELRPSSFFANEQTSDTTTTAIEHGNPTSVEFEDLFSRVLEASLSDSRRLLLVLDNLDRADEADARRILATMQTFTSSTGSPAKPWTRCVWTLIPYDPAGLDRIWNPESTGEDEPEVEGRAAPLTTPTAAAFIEKVFRVRFEAPPLVLSDWRGYLGRLLAQAIPGEAADSGGVLRLRALYPGAQPDGLVAAEAPTPRQLKQFVNQIASIRLQRSDVLLVHIAYYVLLRRDRVNVANGLIHGSLPDPKLSQFFTAEIQADLAALHFGTTQSLAQQLLLGEVLESAFASNEATVIAPLIERPGFVDALDSLDLGNRVLDGGVELTRAVAALDAAGAFAVPAVEAWSTSALLPRVRTVDSWALSGAESGAGIAFVFNSLAGSDDDLNDLLTRVEPDSSESDADGHLQLAGAAALVNTLIAKGRTAESIRLRLNIPDDRLATSLAFFATQATEKRSRAMLELVQSPAEASQALTTAATTGAFVDVIPALDVLRAHSDAVSLGILASGCLEWLGENDPASVDQLRVLLHVVDIARHSGPPEDVLGVAADAGTLMHLVSVANKNEWFAEAAAASMLQLLVRSALPDPQAVREAPVGTQLVRTSLADPMVNPLIVAAQLAWLEQRSREAYKLLIGIATANTGARPWVTHHLNGLWNVGKLVISGAEYVTNWKFLRSVLEGDAFADLTRSLLKSEASRKAIVAKTSDPELAAAAFEVIKSETDESYVSDVRAWGGEVIKASTGEAWQSELAKPDGGPLIELALGLAGTSDAPSDPPGLFDALHVHFQSLAEGEAVWQPNDSDFAKLTGLLGAPARKALAGELGAALEGRDGQVASGLFATYGVFLAGQRDFRTHPKLPGFVARATAHGEWKTVEWFVNLAEAHSDTVDRKGREDELEHLRQQVAERLAQVGDDAAPEALTRLAGVMGVETPLIRSEQDEQPA